MHGYAVSGTGWRFAGERAANALSSENSRKARQLSAEFEHSRSRWYGHFHLKQAARLEYAGCLEIQSARAYVDGVALIGFVCRRSHSVT